jgi:hypothetical protein
MSTVYTLAVADVVELPVKLTVNDGGKTASFSFHLRAKRMPQADLRRALKDEDVLTRDLLVQQVIGWRGQALVLDADGKPADFSRDAFEAMLTLVGMESLVLNAYLRAMGVEAQAERAKN